MLRITLCFGFVSGVFWPAGLVSQQERICDLLSSQEINSAGFTGTRVSYLSNPHFTCTDGTEIRADSSITYESSGLTRLIGSVMFREGSEELHSDDAEYYSSLGRLQAKGNVEVEDKMRGNIIIGDELSLLQESLGSPEDLMTVTGFPAYAILTPPKQAMDASITYSSRIDAKLLHFVGDRILQATGDVTVKRDSLELYGDSLELFQDGSSTKLFSNAKITYKHSTSGEPINVNGDSVNMLFSNNRLDLIQSMGQAEATYGNGSIYGGLVDIYFKNEELERISSRGALPSSSEQEPGDIQATAIISDFTITGDSIDLEFTGDRLVSVTAVGGARGASFPDGASSLDQDYPFLQEDWIEGDTVVIVFSKPQDRDASDTVESDSEDTTIEQMTAVGRARSFFRRPVDTPINSDSISTTTMELNYVRGDEVKIFLTDGQVRQMEVENAQGSFLQPLPRADTATVTGVEINLSYKEDR